MMGQSLQPDYDLPMVDMMGINVATIDLTKIVEFFDQRIVDKQFTKVTFFNAHNSNVAARDDGFLKALRDFLVLPDGIGADIGSKILWGKAFPANLNGTDLIPALLGGIKRECSIGLIGSTKESVERAAVNLKSAYPHHKIVMIRDGYFSLSQDEQILLELEHHKPDILLVAMGVPRQEKWVQERLTSSHCTTVFAVGALFDFLSETMPRAPLWMRKFRMEWVYRLCVEPKRLWHRYIVGNPVFLMRVIKRKLQGPH